MIHLESISVYGKRCRFKFTFLHIDIQFFQYPLLKMLSFSHWIAFIEKSIYHNVKFYFWTINSVPFIPMSIFIPVLQCLGKMFIQLTLKTVLNYPVIYRFFSLNVCYSTMHDCQLAESADAKQRIWRTEYKVIHGFSSVMG